MPSRHAIVLLPPAAFGLIRDHGLREWLSRGQIYFDAERRGPLEGMLADIGAPATECGHAALRYLGQTGRVPVGWLAGADPVSLRPRMRDFVVDALPPAMLPEQDLVEIYATAAAHLEDQTGLRIERHGHLGYLFSDQGFDTPELSPDGADGRVPDILRRQGGSLNTCRRLDSEFQMLLHEHPVNERRRTEGLPPINGLWLWQGGTASRQAHWPLPPVFADDPLFRGHWLSHQEQPEAWPGSLIACAEAAEDAFVAVVPDTAERSPDPWLTELRALQDRRRIGKLSIYSRDGLCVRLTRRDRLRRWKTSSPLLEEHSPNE